jgi:hypothetical protein
VYVLNMPTPLCLFNTYAYLNIQDLGSRQVCFFLVKKKMEMVILVILRKFTYNRVPGPALYINVIIFALLFYLYCRLQ